MKKFCMLLAFAATMIAAVSCGTKKEQQVEDESPKTLVLYYSQTLNTETVAKMIARRLDADIEEIVPVAPYDGDFQSTLGRCKLERERGVLPEIKPINADLAAYDVIFLGYPVWFGTFAPPMAAFLDTADLSGKKVVPFCTFGSGGLESSVKDLAAKQPKAEILTGYGVRAARLSAMPCEVDQFLKAGGFLEGDYFLPDDFPAQQPVTEADKAIFNTAVGDYPMIHAEAKTVALRTIPGGTEYLFTAVDLPREDGQQMPPAGEMQVYVIVKEDAAPEFTRVVR